MLESIVAAVNKRFKDAFNDRELKLAALLRPKIKLSWLLWVDSNKRAEFLEDEEWLIEFLETKFYLSMKKILIPLGE